MKIQLKGKVNTTSNWKGLYINVLHVNFADGDEIIFDRDESDYTINDDGTFVMNWYNVYIWDSEIDFACYSLNDIQKRILEMKYAVSAEIEIEDDVDENYNIQLTDCIVDLGEGEYLPCLSIGA